MVGTLAKLAGVPKAQAEEELGTLRASMKASPSEHGWAPDGRISAYVDEDPLVESSALARLIGVGGCDVSARYKDAVLAGGFASLSAFSEHAFKTATDSFRNDDPPCIIGDAEARLAALERAGAEVVIISNSGAEKIARWFQSVGVDAGEGEGHRLRVRGAAMKWFLGETDDNIECGGRRILIDRPRYREAIEAENPDLIIGDVFSLDLALPHVLRTRGMAQAPSILALRRHAHTPGWIADDRAGGAIDHVVQGVGDLTAIVQAQLQSS